MKKGRVESDEKRSVTKRREKEGAGVSKKDVRRYLNNQKEESVGNTFAQALSGIKLDK